MFERALLIESILLATGVAVVGAVVLFAGLWLLERRSRRG